MQEMEFAHIKLHQLLRRQRRPARFEILLRNCYGQVKDGLPKTNNSVEDWHNKFGSLLAAKHPSIWKFIEELQKQQSLKMK